MAPSDARHPVGATAHERPRSCARSKLLNHVARPHHGGRRNARLRLRYGRIPCLAVAGMVLRRRAHHRLTLHGYLGRPALSGQREKRKSSLIAELYGIRPALTRRPYFHIYLPKFLVAL